MNYLLSATPVTLTTYVTASLIGMLPGTVTYVYLGSALPAAAALAADRQANPGETALYVGGHQAPVDSGSTNRRRARGCGR